ncbi:MAG: valine--tRNA ligase [Candidatus Omnitrophota bacterium]
MDPTAFAPRYHPQEIETFWYSQWEAKGYFRPRSDTGMKATGRPYVIVIPPPNVTGILHMGHALNNSIQDVLVRFQRMKGRDVLWVPGVDHAGIATQNVVEKKLAKEKKTRDQLGRGKFLEEVWKWKEAHGSTITRQLRSLGASCDWSRERFTMDEGLSRAVREAFVTLYERGLIYQGDYIIHWCPRCKTALSDEEAAHKDVQGGLYHIKYPIAPTQGSEIKPGAALEKLGIDHIVVATTRPETMLGDTAVAVNPEDPRYAPLIGKTLILPLIGRRIPVIGDAFVDPEFGTGMVKVTPAHDPNDFEMGIRHHLERVNVMNPDGTINENGGPYRGMDRFQARKKILADLEAQGLFVRRDSHLHAVGHCYRCDTVVEPYLSKQWFVKMKPLAEKALSAHEEGKTRFYPDRWTKVYLHWLRNIRDWCISRQIWWGHQIPVWYDGEGGLYVARSEADALKQAEAKRGKKVVLRQDPDVLDTWFSSWLWPFSTLGWPERTSDLKKFYPTSDLITAPEIIFFWVARMIMAGLEFEGKEPFSRIYIHGTVRAEGGLKMSKSLGNSIDPLEVIGEMGADALRFSMIMLSAQDVYLSREKFEVGRNFTNKIWNASRFVLLNIREPSCLGKTSAWPKEGLGIADRWILSRLQGVQKRTEDLLSEFALAQAASELYHFIWNDFCDWTIELAKPVLTGEEAAARERTARILFGVLERSLRMLHPFMPFITEEIWQKLRGMAPEGDRWPESIMLAEWPEPERAPDPEAERCFGMLQTAVSGIRDLRMRLGIDPAQKVEGIVAVRRADEGKIFEQFRAAVEKLAGVRLRVVSSFNKDKNFPGTAFADFDVHIGIEGLLDPAKEKARVGRKVEETKAWIGSLRAKLAQEHFVRNAPAEIVARETQKLEDAEKLLRAHEEILRLFE